MVQGLLNLKHDPATPRRRGTINGRKLALSDKRIISGIPAAEAGMGGLNGSGIGRGGIFGAEDFVVELLGFVDVCCVSVSYCQS
jgi:hypothetical protein